MKAVNTKWEMHLKEVQRESLKFLSCSRSREVWKICENWGVFSILDVDKTSKKAPLEKESSGCFGFSFVLCCWEATTSWFFFVLPWYLWQADTQSDARRRQFGSSWPLKWTAEKKKRKKTLKGWSFFSDLLQLFFHRWSTRKVLLKKIENI